MDRRVDGAGTLSRYHGLDALSQDCLELRDEADVCNSLLQHDCDRLGASRLVDRLFQLCSSNTIPALASIFALDDFFKSEISIEFEVEGMVLADFCIPVLFRYLPRYMELAGLRIEVQGLYSNRQVGVDSLGGRSASCSRFGRYAPYGGGG